MITIYIFGKFHGYLRRKIAIMLYMIAVIAVIKAWKHSNEVI